MVHREGGREFHGFMRYRPSDADDLIAVTMIDGQPETWWVESEGAVEGLRRFYREVRHKDAAFRIFRAVTGP